METKKLLAQIAVLAVAGAVCQAQPPGFRMKKNPEVRYTLQSGQTTMAIDAANGARIVSLKYDETEILSQREIPNQYGSTFWTSPQKEWNWPPVYEHDMAAYEVQQLEDGALLMTSQLSQKFPVRIIKRFAVNSRQPGFVVTYTIKNESDQPRKVAPWEITRVLAEGTVTFDADVSQITPAGLMNFKQNAQGLAEYEIDHVEGQNRKINSDGKGWLTYAGKGLLLTKRFADLTPDQPAPAEAEIQIYVHEGNAYVELESQGAYTELQPGEQLDWAVEWTLEKAK